MTELDLLPTTGDTSLWSDRDKAIADTIGMTAKVGDQVVVAPLGVRETFLVAVRTTGLDPIMRQIYLMYVGGKWLVTASIDGLRTVAQRTGEYRGQSQPEWTDGTKTAKPFMVDGKPYVVDGQLIMAAPTTDWTDVWVDTKNPVAARVFVHRSGFAEPLEGIATWAGYGKTTGQWKGNGPHMLAKCAEALALRKAFPMELSGIYSQEEIDSGAVGASGRDWLDELKDTHSVEEWTLLADALRESGEWTPKLEAKFKARRSTLIAMEAEREAEPETIVVSE